MKNILKIVSLSAVIFSFFLHLHGTASAAASPFTCNSNFYQVISGQLKLLDPVTGSYSNVGSYAGFSYNAIGYNTLDNYIYGIEVSGAQSGDLIQVASDGSITDLGLPAGLPRSGYIAGTFDLAGNLYTQGSGQIIYETNIATMTTTTLTITGSTIPSAADMVFINNHLYLLTGSNLSVIDLATDTATTGTVNGPSGWLTASNTFGAGWADYAGELFFSNNGSGSIYQITDYDSPTPTATFKVTGTVTSSNDGASCLLAAQSPFDAPVANNDSYTTLYNTPLHQTTASLLSNDLGNTLTITSHTNPAHGTVIINADGTFIYTPQSGFNGTDDFTYTITDSLGRVATATVNIVVDPPAVPNTGFGTPTTHRPWQIAAILGALSVTTAVAALLVRKRITESL